MRRVRLWAATALVLMAGNGCGGSDATGPTSGEIKLTPDAVIVAQGQGLQLSVSVLDDKGRLLAGAPVTFESSDTLMVTVSPTGAVRSVGPAGFATVTAKTGRLSAEVAVAVTPTATRISVSPAAVTLQQLGTAQLSAQLLDATGQPVPHSPVTYTSLNTAMATVSTEGVITSVGPAGQVLIDVASGRFFVDVAVTISQVPAAISVTPNPIVVGVGSQAQPVVHVTDAVHVDIPNSPVTYSAAPSSLITVNSTGRITSVGGAGSGTLTVVSGNLRMDVPVNVVELGHPLGTIVATTPMDGQPWGAAVSGSGVVYVVGVLSVLGRAALPSFALTTTPLAGGVTTAAAFNHAGTQAWIANAPTGSVAVYDPGTNALLGTASGLDGDVYGVLVSPDDHTVYAGTGNNSVYAINATTRAIEWQVTAAGPVIHMAQHPTLPLVYASTPGAISEIDLTTHAVRTLSASVSHAQAIAVSADGSELYIADENSGGLEVYNLSTGQTTNVPLGCSGYGLALSPDDAVIYVSCLSPGRIIAVDRGTRSVIATVTTNGGPRRLAISPDGLTLVAPNESGWVDFIR